MIVAMSSNRIIGINNQLPWKLSADMAWFKKNTLNKSILLGRKTWESLPIRPLPGRKHIILSNNKNYQALSISGEKVEGISLVTSVEEAIEKAKGLITAEQDELMVIGGATIYQLMLPYCDRLYITQVTGDFEGDAWFPEFDTTQWQDDYFEPHKADDKNQFDFSFIIKNRISLGI